MLTNREIVSIILLGLLLFLCLVKTDFRKSLREIVYTFLQHKIVIVILIFLAYAALLVWLAAQIGLWDFKLFKDTVFTTLVVGFPMMFGATQVKDGAYLVRKVALATIGASAFVAFYLNLVSFNLMGEFLLQIVVAFAAILSVAAKHQGSASLVVGRIMDCVLAVIGLVLLMVTTVKLHANWQDMDLKTTGLTFAMSIWLPLALLPFIYVLSFYAATESVFIMLPFFNERKKANWKVRLAIFIGFHVSVRYASNFTGQWRAEVASLTSYRATREVMRRYRSGHE